MRRGEVWEVNLDPTLGAEIKKTRPCVIVSRAALGRLPLKIIVPLTAWQDRYEQAPWHVAVEASPENGLLKKSSADNFQVRSISDKRLVKKIGELTSADLEKIAAGLALSLALD